MISPQGYKLGEDPTSKNPFWGEGEDSNVNKIYATATVDNGTGVPSVSTSKTVSGNDITFGFDFHNLKGEIGPQGPAGATGATGPAGPAGPAGADGAPGATGATGPQGPEGPKGDTGATGPAGPQGPEGPEGPQGPAGPQGEAGVAGADGVSPTARVVQTGDNQATIYVTDKSGETSAVLTGEVGPAGPQGPAGEKGDTGATGPQGPSGEKGETGATGPQGPAGPGVPSGGTAGQVLTKKSGTDYDTEWKDVESGGSVKVKYTRGIYPSLENIAARGKITISHSDYVNFENASNIIPIMTSLEIQAGTNDLIVTGIRTYTNDNSLTVEVDVYNASSSAYNTSSYPMSPNNVNMTWLVLLI